jgi:hypothetical protein
MIFAALSAVVSNIGAIVHTRTNDDNIFLIFKINLTSFEHKLYNTLRTTIPALISDVQQVMQKVPCDS